MVNPTIKLIVVFLILGVLVFYPLHVAKAASGWLLIMKEFALDLIGRIIGRVLMSTLGNSVTNVILTSGRDIDPITGKKGPAFIRDWRQFMQRAQYRGEDVTRATIYDAISADSGTICAYLRNPLGSAFGAKEVRGFQAFAYRLDSLLPYKTRNRCTLPAGFNVNTFRNDFSTGGGWEAWDKLIQPQNNFFGVYADSLDELAKQREFEEKQDTNESAGSGYTSRRTGCDGEGENKQCTILGKVVTPADLFSKTGAETINKEFGWLFSADEIQEALVSLAGMVVSRLTNFVDEKAGKLGEDSNNLGPGTGEATPPPDAVQRSQEDCVKSKEAGCATKATVLKCDAEAEGGDGGGGDIDGGGGDGGDASVNCVEKIDQGIYDSCMAEARAICGF